MDDQAEIEKKKRKKMEAKAAQMWKDFTYKDLMHIPPKKKPCFLAGTLVHTSVGLVPVEQIEIGQQVYTYNFEKGINELKPVLEKYVNKTEKYLQIFVGKDIIEVTGNHRFWLPEKKIWQVASKLLITDMLLSKKAKQIKIDKLVIVDEIKDTYNLEVQDNPNYYVGKNALLAHNATKISKFASKEKIFVEFYELIDSKKEVLYVGQTIQKRTAREAQHLNDTKKPWRNKIKGSFEIYPKQWMTPYEAAVVEMYEMNYRGGKTGLFNKVNPISKRKFNKFKDLGFNPCKFYV